MSTKDSPLWKLKGEASVIAARMKMAERGEIDDPRIKASRLQEPFKVGIVMDDKLITIEMAWADIAAATEEALAAMVLAHMREEQEH